MSFYLFEFGKCGGVSEFSQSDSCKVADIVLAVIQSVQQGRKVFRCRQIAVGIPMLISACAASRLAVMSPCLSAEISESLSPATYDRLSQSQSRQKCPSAPIRWMFALLQSGHVVSDCRLLMMQCMSGLAGRNM